MILEFWPTWVLKKWDEDQNVCFLELFGGTGAIFACFHRAGTWPCLTDALKMAQMGSVMNGAMSFSIQLGIASGPVDLCTLIRVSFWYTSNGSIMKSSV